jgi:large subunit ribosomal protein L3
LKAIIGRKIGMTQAFSEDGDITPVTLVQAGPCTVTQIRTIENDGYQAMQLGFEEAKKLGKAIAGQFKKAKVSPRIVREIRLKEVTSDNEESAEETVKEVGQKLDVSQFEPGDVVVVTGVSKGKGFAGTIKRHNFHRGPKTHGSRSYRRPGSIGSMYPQKIFKGKKMAGRMGSDTVTKRSVKVFSIDPSQNLLALAGSIPGARRSIVIIKGAK